MHELELLRWRALGASERRAAAEAVARQLPAGFVLVDVLGEVATFARHGRRFALVPGGEHELGFEPDGWQPDDDERASYQASAEAFGVEHGLVEHVTLVTLRRRTVRTAPLLVETTASELGWEPASPEQVRDALAGLPADGRPYTITSVRDGAQLRVRRGADGVVTCERAIAGATHATLAAGLAADGFRFPTSDEWELACGAGAATLFRWGDHAPCDRSPVEPIPDGAIDSWAPNRFGLEIAAEPYRFELVAEPDRTRGADGGVLVCGGAGHFLEWLTLATAYFEDAVCRRDPAAPIQPSYTIGRRVLALT